jgi:hypothetical protein
MANESLSQSTDFRFLVCAVASKKRPKVRFEGRNAAFVCSSKFDHDDDLGEQNENVQMKGEKWRNCTAKKSVNFS